LAKGVQGGFLKGISSKSLPTSLYKREEVRVSLIIKEVFMAVSPFEKGGLRGIFITNILRQRHSLDCYND